MIRRLGLAAIALIGLALASSAGQAATPRVDPFPLRFPLTEAGTLEIEGRIVGQPKARDGIVYFATSDAALIAVVVPSRTVLWRFPADRPLIAGPELGEQHILVRDDADTLYALDPSGAVAFKTRLPAPVTTAVRESEGRIYFGGAGNKVLALEASGVGAPGWEYPALAPVTAGPVFVRGLVVFGTADGRVVALGTRDGRPVWEFAAEGEIAADPVESGGRLYFGTEARRFYCLNASSGKRLWSRRLQGAPVHPALISGRRVFVAASNSVVYVLARRGGSIVSWEPVASRLLYEPAAAGALALISSAAPGLRGLDRRTGAGIGEYPTAGFLAAGAIWSAPFVLLFEEDQMSGRQRLTALVGKR